MAHATTTSADSSSSLEVAWEERIVVEIPLSQATEGSLCRHGRRRLRDMQAKSAARIRYDRARSVLKVSGPSSAVEEVQRQLDCLGGVKEVVPTAVWCELMRTRLEEDPSKSALQNMQKQSGCRIHIERSLQEVRIFGSSQNTQVALHLLHDFARRCTEVSVPSDEGSVSEDLVQRITDEHAVTVNVEKRRVVVYGIKAAVRSAVRELRAHFLAQVKPGEASLGEESDSDADWDDGVSTCSISTWCNAVHLAPEKESRLAQEMGVSSTSTISSDWSEEAHTRWPQHVDHGTCADTCQAAGFVASCPLSACFVPTTTTTVLTAKPENYPGW
eukprot:CAMPEP_0178406212 /NCGR_PEP_ID=MMETSP0689_2-20121128/18797_1 /TAXON_ID=160604 /ORGANISM="Amphidinium massartii, Strain CS-259" /LENGTH=329 /DNA_ID=CAMNT_0020027249 /DNA_START=94 /DNA_END=1080 /DNA_ORIENTATION=-